MQANASLAPNSWEQYVSAIIEYYNVTSGSTQLSNSTAAPGETRAPGAKDHQTLPDMQPPLCCMLKTGFDSIECWKGWAATC